MAAARCFRLATESTFCGKLLRFTPGFIWRTFAGAAVSRHSKPDHWALWPAVSRRDLASSRVKF